MLFNFVSAILLLASSLHGLNIISPGTASTFVSGTNVILNVATQGDVPGTTGTITVTFTGRNGAFATTSIPNASIGQDFPFLLPATFASGYTTVTATPVGFTSGTADSTIVTVVSVTAPLYPVCPLPCYNNNNYVDPWVKPDCNVPRARCSARKAL